MCWLRRRGKETQTAQNKKTNGIMIDYIYFTECFVNIVKPEAYFIKYKIVLEHSEEGVSVSVPGLPGCWSQGSSEEEALEMIRDAIREYLAVVDEQFKEADTREIEITVK